MPTAPSWDESAAAAMTPLARLAHRARLLGADPRIVPRELGSVSAKLGGIDPFTAQPVDVLWVTGAGADLRRAAPEQLASLYLDSVLSLEALSLQGSGRQIAGMYRHCAFDLNDRAPAEAVAIHAFLPGRHVDLTQPEAVMAIAAARSPAALAQQIFGEEVAWLPTQRPGLELALKVRDLCAARPALRGIILGTLGFATWADDDRACYDHTVRLIGRAAAFLAEKDRGDAALGGRRHPPLGEAQRRLTLAKLLPWLRGRLGESAGQRGIAHVDAGEDALRWLASHDGPRLSAAGAASLPGHLRRARFRPLHVEWDPHKGDGIQGLRDKLTVGLTRYRREYIAYYRKHKREDSPPIRNPNPAVFLIPGLGIVAWGADKPQAEALAQWTGTALAAAAGAETLDKYQPLTPQETFDFEYGAPAAEPERGRRVYAVVGAGSGIGRELAGRLVRAGAHVVCADINHAAAQAVAAEFPEGAAWAVQTNIADRASVRALLDEMALQFGGCDGIAVTAGLYIAPDAAGRLSDERWRQTYEVNVMGCYLLADEAAKTWRDQGLSASLALTTSAHAAPGGGSLAFEASQAAANQLVRELAVELGPLIRVNAVAPAGIVQGSGMYPRARVTAALARHEIAYRESETDEALREKLARFYAERTLLKAPVLPGDAAEALYLLLGDRLGKTTGQILTVDGGSRAAFLR